ncbi:GNAT family N-acetyltransferase [Flexivirga alba]|uniref:GNAT family N-acetyltransferase n=1 Tax=Flexivirga alba TaxID=702742 RepID=A0ABW2AFI7_9MICO
MPSESVSQSHLTELLVIGRRVVLRSRLALGDSEPGGPTLTDTLGEVMSVTDEEVVVDTRNGPVTVARASIMLAKRVPPPPPRRAPRAHPNAISIDELEELAVDGMPPLESAHIGDWLLRAADGYTGRANSALPLGDPGVPGVAAVEQVVAWYAERDQPALVHLPHGTGADPTASPLGTLLAKQDWRFFLRTLVMTKVASDDEPAQGDAKTADVRIEVSDDPTDDWWHTASPRALDHRDTLGRMLERVRSAAYLTAYLDGRPAGHGRLVFTDGWSGIFDIHTDPAVRGRGIARALMRRAERTAIDRRIPLQYLQVAADNESAVGLYRSLGWQVHHEYHYATPEV